MSIFEILQEMEVKRGRPRLPELGQKRDQEIVEKYLGGKSSIDLGEEYGVSRERICQILRRENIIAKKQMRDRAGKEMFAAQKQAWKEEHKAKLAQAVAAVAAGSSIMKAANTFGFGHMQLGYACMHAGITSRHGRHRNFAARVSRLRQLHAEGLTLSATILILRSEGELVHTNWVHQHVSDLQWKRGRPFQKDAGPHASPPKPQRVPNPPKLDPESYWLPERVVELKRLWLSGTSAQQLVDIFGPPITRNMILGKLHRLRLSGELQVSEAN